MKIYISVHPGKGGYMVELQSQAVTYANDPIGPFETQFLAHTWIAGYVAGVQDAQFAGVVVDVEIVAGVAS